MDAQKIQKIAGWFKSIISGDILLRMRVDRLFPYILYAFVLGWFSIWMSYKTEQTMLKVQKNNCGAAITNTIPPKITQFRKKLFLSFSPMRYAKNITAQIIPSARNVCV